MNCPKCQMAMETLTHAGVEVDRCTNCRGIWFDAVELDELRSTPGAEVIDTGNQNLGQEYNKQDRFPCPKCQGNTMIRLVDPQQPHIWFEQCKVCGGTFLDAGEFRDLREENIWDFFKSIRARKRA